MTLEPFNDFMILNGIVATVTVVAMLIAPAILVIGYFYGKR